MERSIFLSIAEHYSRELAQNTRDGLAARFKQGGFCGGVVPFGYALAQKDGKKFLVVEPSEAEIIEKVVGIYLRETIGLKALAQRLEKMGIPTRRGARWCHTTVRSILTNPMLVGRTRFLRRQMKLSRTSGKRLPKFRDEGSVLTHRNPTLRILTNGQYHQVQRIIKERGYQTKTPRLPRDIRAFTGLAFCSECGAICYTTRSQNSKGDYYYLACGNRCRHGKDACPTSGRIREEILLETIREDYAAMFDNVDDVVAVAIQRAMEFSQSQQKEVSRIKSEIVELDRKIARIVDNLVGPDFDASGRRALSQSLGGLQQRREELHHLMGGLAEKAGENTEKLALAIRRALNKAKAALVSVMRPAELNRFVSRFIGQIEVRGDGTVAKKEPGHPALSHQMTGDIAGGGLTLRPATITKAALRAIFWSQFRKAA